MHFLKNAYRPVKLFLFLPIILIFLHACKPDEVTPPSNTNGKLNLKIDVTANGTPVSLSQAYTNANGQILSMDLFKFYLGNISLMKQDGSDVLLKDVLLVDLSNQIKEPFDPKSIGTNFTFDVAEGQYTGLKAGIGVPKNINVVKTNYPNEHPLSIYRGTDWAWAGYRFIMLEGKARNSASEPLQNFEYHIATDTFYQQKNIIKTIEIKGAETTGLTLTFELNDFLQPADMNRKLDLTKELFTHSEGSQEEIDLAWKVTHNFRDAFAK